MSAMYRSETTFTWPVIAQEEGPDLERKAKRIYHAWYRFMRRGELEPYVIRPMIERSWFRCMRKGLDPHQSLDHLQAGGRMEDTSRQDAEFLGVATRFVDDMHDFVKGSHHLLALADSQGRLLKVVADPVVERQLKHVPVVGGTSWSEATVGTNAVGLALVEQAPVQVFAGEHYCQALHGLTSSAVPVFGPGRNLLGAIGLIGPYQYNHMHSLGMVVATVLAVENELTCRSANEQLLAVYRHVETLMETVSDGLMCIDQQMHIAQLNPAATRMLGTRTRELLNRPVKEVFGPSADHLAEIMRNERSTREREITLEMEGNPLVRLNATVRVVFSHRGMALGLIAVLRRVRSVAATALPRVGPKTFTFADIVGDHPQLLDLIGKAKKVAQGDSTVLLLGESGTGKEMFAQAIHNYSTRCEGPFVVVNCGAIPRELVESELFGYEEGAFTGARRGGRPGKFELASGGTIFLDEISDMPMESQATLLRVLQDRAVVRIGGTRTVPVDIRVIAATHKDLWAEVRKGTFRADLYYRLNVVIFSLPSLRERRDDIRRLAEHFIGKLSSKMGRAAPLVAEEVWETLMNYEWPGNVRELENVIEQALNFMDGDILQVAHFPSRFRRSKEDTTGEDPAPDLAHMEAALIGRTLAKMNGNVSRAAKALGIGRTTLYRKMRRYGIVVQQE